jgi:hypothetical protein
MPDHYEGKKGMKPVLGETKTSSIEKTIFDPQHGGPMSPAVPDTTSKKGIKPVLQPVGQSIAEGAKEIVGLMPLSKAEKGIGSSFQLRSGNATAFKMMGSSVAKHSKIDGKDHTKDGGGKHPGTYRAHNMERPEGYDQFGNPIKEPAAAKKIGDQMREIKVEQEEEKDAIEKVTEDLGKSVATGASSLLS